MRRKTLQAIALGVAVAGLLASFTVHPNGWLLNVSAFAIGVVVGL